MNVQLVPNQYEKWCKFTAASSTTISIKSLNGGIQIAIGGHRFVSEINDAFYVSTSVTGTSHSYSSDDCITGSGLPVSAVVTRLRFMAHISRNSFTNWRYKRRNYFGHGFFK